MAVANNFYLLLGGTNVSAFIRSMNIKPMTKNTEFNLNAPGATAARVNREVGVEDISIDVTFSHDTGASAPYQLLRTLFKTTFAVVAAMNGATASTTNHTYSFTGIFGERNEGGEAGGDLTQPLTISLANGAVTVATA